MARTKQKRYSVGVDVKILSLQVELAADSLEDAIAKVRAMKECDFMPEGFDGCNEIEVTVDSVWGA